MHVFTGGDVESGLSDDLAVTDHVVTHANRTKRDFVAERYPIAGLHQNISGGDVFADLDIFGCGGDVVALIEQHKLHPKHTIDESMK